MRSFGKYSQFYDLIYRDKDYVRECDFVEDVFERYSLKRVETILDGGCGTGGHALALARKGHHITGIDSSEAMLKIARGKAADAGLSVDFRSADLCDFDLGREYDACICMFAVMDYITETDGVLRALRNIRRHLGNGSLLLFDVWNGLAVLRILPSVKVKVAEDSEARIVRIAEPELDALNHLCRVHYRLLIFGKDGLTEEILETHVIRYYFPQEMAHYLSDSGFELVRICPFLDLDGELDENEWNAAIVARAV